MKKVGPEQIWIRRNALKKCRPEKMVMYAWFCNLNPLDMCLKKIRKIFPYFPHKKN